MNDAQNAKLDLFIKDQVMSDAVYEVIRDAFLSKKGKKDIQVLAAERLAIDLLDDAWKELSKFNSINSEKQSQSGNVGL